ncbi:pentapeptide repeat-containing protein [Asticcacaulis taihuensis]|uniref:pentapeptide repeat-containing protein n=1 Tax=Asticcacaulis taihuensis TaxID=260084 RepID=UPI003F7CCCFF
MPEITQSKNLEVSALEKAWWDDWWAEDFSWDGLAEKTVNGLKLQDIWLDEAGSLISEPGTGRRWTRLHCPFNFKDGTPSPKASWTRSEWDAVAGITGNATAFLTGVVLESLELDNEFTTLRADNAYIGKAIVLDFLRLHCSLRSAWISGFYSDPSFLESADFRKTTFTGPAIFSKTIFSTGARFAEARFLGLAQFIESRFEGIVARDENTDFSGATFAYGADFSEANFEAEAIFNGAKFAGRTNFFGAKFEDRALFDDIECLENIHFYKAAFVRRLTINNARFYGKANFEGITDGDPIALSAQPITLKMTDATASGELSPGTGPTPRSYLALPKLLAKGAIFYQDANFSNRDLLSPSTFESAQFLHLARFHGSDVHANVSFHNTIFRRALAHRPLILPPFPEDMLKLRFTGSDSTDYRQWKKSYLKERATKLRDQFGRNSYFDALEASYRTLKQMMEDRRDRIREGEFFTLELLARRKRSDVAWWERGFSWLYATFANYGNSIFRPLFGLLACLIVFTAAYYQAGEQLIFHKAPYNSDHLIAAFSFAWHNMFAPFSVLDASKAGDGDAWLNALLFGSGPLVALGIRIAGTIESMLTILLAFLTVLAARRRFQIN